jgi:ribosomal protein L11 methyltransferase
VEELPGRFRAAFTDPVAAERCRDAVAPDSPIERVDDAHGLDAARDLLTVEFAGRFAVHPPWLAPPADRLPIEIDPGHAFGSGSHPSTRLALELLGENEPPPATVFDVGCGTGVLAIGAALLGARVIAVDIDPAAIAATTANADRNRVADHVEVRTGSADLVAAATDLVTINVTIDIHERIAPTLHRAHRRLVVAGVLGEEQLRRCARAYGATVTRSITHDGWMAAVLSRP